MNSPEPYAEKTGLSAFREGLAVPWEGFRFMRARPRLWTYGVAPVLLNLLITALLLALLVGIAAYFIYVLHPKFDDTGWGRAFEVLAALGILVVAVGLSFVAWVVLQGILCGRFYERLARRVEQELGLPDEQFRELSLAAQAADSIADAGYLLAVNSGCLALQIVPVLGTIAGLGGSYYLTCMRLGMEYLDYPLNLRGLRRSERRAFAGRHRPHVLGLGTAVAVLTLVPIVNAVLLTTAVTGAVLLHRRLSRDHVETVQPLVIIEKGPP